MDDLLTFILAAKLPLKDLKILLTEVQKDIDDVKFLQKFKNDTIFGKPITYPLGPHLVRGYVYYDPKLEQSERETLRSRLHDIREELLRACLKKNSNAFVVFREKA